MESGVSMKQPIYPNRHRFLAIERNFGKAGKYTTDTAWIVNREYNSTATEYVAAGFARWIKSLGSVNAIRFDGEGDGQFSEIVCHLLKIAGSDIVSASEFSPKLRRKIALRKCISEKNIIPDALIPPDHGGTMVVIANQLLDAFPFAVMRRRTRGVILEELAVSGRNEYRYQRLINASLHEDADLVGDSRNGLFTYSPAKINYINNILSRAGKTYLAIIDYSASKMPDEYMYDTGSIAYSPTSLSWLIKMAKKHNGKIIYSDHLVVWPYLREPGQMNEPIGWQNLTIIETENEAKDENVCKA